jgi:hypothetical protein
MSSVRRWYPPFFVACIVALSVQTLVQFRASGGRALWLATVEIVAAVGLLARPVRRAALLLLLAVFAVAAIITLHVGRSMPIYLLLYGAGAIAAVAMLDERTSSTTSLPDRAC